MTKTFSSKPKKSSKKGSASKASRPKASRTFDSSNKKIHRETNPNPTAGSARTAASGTPHERIWSPQQEAIFKECKSGSGHVLVTARAGTGKTTTILEATKYLSGDILLCAFNKRIAEELQARLDAQPGPQVRAQTLHSLGFGFLRRAIGTCVLDDRKPERIIAQVYEKNNKGMSKDSLYAMKRLCAMVKETMLINPRNITETSEAIEITDVAFGCTDLLAPAERGVLLELAPYVIQAMTNLDGTCDFSDMLYLPLVHDFVRPTFDVVIVDEAQDMNAAQLEIAKRAVKKNGRIIVVGDDRQAIYGFRGADSNSMARLKQELNAKELKLTTTYRCGKQIVALAQEYVSDFQAAPTAHEGFVGFGNSNDLYQRVKAGDFVLSRTNAPLMSVCLQMIRRGIPARIEGKDVGRGLQGIIYKLKAKHITEVSTLVGEWANKVVSRLNPERDEARIEQVYDQADVLSVLAEDCDTVQHLLSQIDKLFADNLQRNAVVTCSTIHKAKGLEANVVFILEDSFYKKKGAPPSAEEANIRYVAITRAIQELWHVGKKLNQQETRHEEVEQEADLQAGHDEYGKPL